MSKPKKPTPADIERMKKPFIKKGKPIPDHVRRIEKHVEKPKKR